ncbi:MAG: YunG family protein [Bacteriovoracia bacterium]
MDKKNLLQLALYRSYSQKTAYPGYWNKENPYIGQCAVTAMVVNDFLGGDIAKIKLPNLSTSHYFNIIDSKVVDLTSKQFSWEYKLDYSNSIVKRREDIRGSNIENRYKILKKKVDSFLNSFSKLQKNIQECKKCSFVEHLKGPIIKIGKNTDILFVGEAPAPDGWRKSQKAFYNPDGKLLPTGKNLQKLLNVLDISLENITYTEVIKCKPNSRKDLEKAADNCKSYMLKQLDLLKPKIIFPLGSSASTLLLENLGYENLIFKEIKGKTFETNNFLILPLQHPSPANPYGLSFNIPILKKFVESRKYKDKINYKVYLDIK